MSSKKSAFRFITADYIFISLILIIAAFLNLQFLEGSNINYKLAGHDEYLTVREVYSILHPISFKHFLMAIISGDVLYYGRIVFYTDALIAFLPFRIFGLDGMVYAIRMTHVLCIILSLWLLAKTFLNNWQYRLLFFAGTMTLYYSAYFFMIPKPEPIQLLLLAMFFYYFKKNHFTFGRSFIFLGLAYGAKFNIITILPFVFILPFLNRDINFVGQIKRCFMAVFYFLTGLVIAVPCLILAPVKPVFLQSYFNATFANTGQYDDDATLTTMEWISKGWFGAYNGGTIGGILLVLLVLIILIYGIRNLIMTRQINNELLVLITGLCLIIPVVLFTGRLWPHYLWTGYIFIFLGLIIFIQRTDLQKFTRYFSMLLLIGIMGWSLKCSYAQGRQLFSLEENSKSLQESGRKTYRYLKANNKKFIAIQDITVPYPFKEMLQINRYNPFTASYHEEIGQQFIWSGFISPVIIDKNKADFVIIHKIDFETLNSTLQTEKDSTTFKNNQLMRSEIGKTVFLDTSFEKIKVYKVIRQNNQ